MCVAPVKVQTPSGAQLVACRECWQCKQRKIDDYIGRNIAESKTAKKCHAFTLTYGTDEEGSADHIRARILTYSDVQKFIKKLRAAGFPCRYFVVGEYGGEKGRAHWHGLIYWLDKVPDFPLRKKRTHSLGQWEHGYSYMDDPSVQAIRYACKYITKDMNKGGKQGEVHFSRMPPLGSEYFKQLAEAYVQAGKAPNTLEYSFPGVTRLNRATRRRELIKFRMSGKSAEIFADHFLAEWERVHGKPWNYMMKGSPIAEAIAERADELAKPEVEKYLNTKRFVAYDHDDPKNIAIGKAIKHRLMMEELIWDRLWADHLGVDSPKWERIAEDNWLKINVLGKSNGKER